jgi:hypothetical protein
MGGDLREELAAALSIENKPICEIQRIYNEYKKYMSGKIIKTPLPEEVHLCDLNFPYWIHLGTPDPTDPTKWIGAKAEIVIPMLDAGIFNDAGLGYDQLRARALPYVPVLLRNPNCIHVNLRHVDGRGDGGIRGNYVYVEYGPKKKRRVAFTLMDEREQRIILVSSFGTYKNWVKNCAEMPAIYVKPGRECTCGK